MDRLCRVCIFFLAASCAAAFVFPLQSNAATFKWEALPDRERISIRLQPNDGIAGNVARIDRQALVVPFTTVPPTLVIDKSPEGAQIFDKTEQLGNALTFLTKTPAFGYVVTKKNQDELVIDFFQDKMGVRWRPTGQIAPTTEIVPQVITDAVTVPSPSVPVVTAQHNASEEVPTPTGVNTPHELQAEPSANTIHQEQPAITSVSSQTGSITATGQPNERQDSKVQPPSQPAESAQGSEASQKLPAVQVPVSDSNAMNPFLDSRKETSERLAPLPTPAPVSGAEALLHKATTEPSGPKTVDSPLGLAVVAANTGQPTQSGEAPARLETQQSERPASSATTPAVEQRSIVTKSTTAQPQKIEDHSPSASPVVKTEGRQSVEHAQEPSSATEESLYPYLGVEDEELPVGTAVYTGPGISYRGKANAGGADTLEQPAASPVKSPASEAAAKEILAMDLPMPSPSQHEYSASALPAAQRSGHGPEKKPEGHPATSQPSGEPAAPHAIAATGGEHSGAKSNQGAAHALDASAQQQASTQQGAAESGGHKSSTESSQASGHEAGVPAEGQVIYVDEHGNPVEPPADPAQVIPQIAMDISAGNYQAALEAVEKLLKQTNLDTEARETCLHMRAEILFALHQKELDKFGYKIIEASKEAISYNPDSEKNAGTLLRIGFVYLKLKNIPEAEAYFNILRRQYPQDSNIPLTYYYWGDYHYSQDDLQKAADEFQYVLQNYPNSRFAREAALGLARSFYRMGYYKEAFDVVDYIEKRWSRFYLDYPPFLNMMGDVAFRLKEFDYALSHYWLYVNLEPSGDEVDVILTRIGDIYSQTRQAAAATTVYQECVRRFPNKDGGLVAQMRLAEANITDEPTISGMFSIFDMPRTNPQEVYKKIIDEHPTSALAPLAELKLAMWYLWNHDYLKALDICSDFAAKYPKSDLLPKVKEVALKTFATMASESIVDGRQSRMRDIWERYPIVQSQEEILSPESRLALAVSFWKEGKPDDALATIEPFFLGNKVSDYSEAALNLVLHIYLEFDQWAALLQVAKKVELWELSAPVQNQLDYAVALSYENLGNAEKAAPLWEKLHNETDLTKVQQAYVFYFLAKDAERKRELEKAYSFGTESLNRLLDVVSNSPNQADLAKVKSQLSSLMNIAETAGRLDEALKFATDYLQYLDANSEERAAVMYKMARIYKQQGNDPQWQKTLQDIIVKFPESLFAQMAQREQAGGVIEESAAKYSSTGQL